jgi:hypothetical protein
MAAANPLWRAPRIHGELKMLGIEISERTISRLLRELPRRPGQSWKTFLHNHAGQMVSMDFFTVPTITMKVLFGRSSKPSPIRTRPGISSEIETASTATKFGCGSHHSRWKKCSPRRGVPGRIRTPNG